MYTPGQDGEQCLTFSSQQHSTLNAYRDVHIYQELEQLGKTSHHFQLLKVTVSGVVLQEKGLEWWMGGWEWEWRGWKQEKPQYSEAACGGEERVGPGHQQCERLSSGLAPPPSKTLRVRPGKRHLPAAEAVETQSHARGTWMTLWASPWAMDGTEHRDLRL